MPQHQTEYGKWRVRLRGVSCHAAVAGLAVLRRVFRGFEQGLDFGIDAGLDPLDPLRVLCSSATGEIAALARTHDDRRVHSGAEDLVAFGRAPATGGSEHVDCIKWSSVVAQDAVAQPKSMTTSPRSD